MSRILLVRHAQASFLAPDYDRLSSLGEKQAGLLGEYWAERRVNFDRVYAGPRARQADTAKIVAAAYRAAQLRFPEAISMCEFDEYQGEAVLRTSVPQLAETDPTIRELHQTFLASESGAKQRKAFQKLFETVIGRWVDGEVALPGIEPWSEFCDRVNRGLSKVMSDAQPNEQLAIFSSGGPIAVALQRALNLSSRDTLGVSWMSRNCSFSEFLFSADRFTLSMFNAFPHLDRDGLLTYR